MRKTNVRSISTESISTQSDSLQQESKEQLQSQQLKNEPSKHDAQHTRPAWMSLRPTLSPGVHVLWRSQTEVQLGIDPRKALVLPATHATEILSLCNGVNTIESIATTASQSGISKSSIINLLIQLVHSGLTQDCNVREDDTQNSDQELNVMDRKRKVRDLCGEERNLGKVPLQQRLMVQRESHSNGARNRRFTTEIHLWGLGRLGITIAGLLASAGYPLLRFHDNSKVTSDDLISWGYSWVDIGNRRDVAATQMTEHLYRGFSERNHFQRTHPQQTLHVYAPDSCADYPWARPDLTTSPMSNDEAHLIAMTAGSIAKITSVIEPGQTSCWRCMHLNQCEVDTSWSLISGQLIDRHVPDTSPVGLITLAGLQTLSIIGDWVDNASPISDVTYEIAWPSNQTIIQPQSANPSCGCMWDRQVA